MHENMFGFFFIIIINMISSDLLQQCSVMVLYSEYWSVSILRTRGSHYKNVNETKMIEYKVLVVESCVQHECFIHLLSV